MPDLVTAAQLQLFARRCDYLVLGPALSAAAVEFKIDTPLRLAHWLGQLHVESLGLTRLVEDLTYSAARLVEVWPSRFPSLAVAQPFAGAPKLLAERVYGGRKDLGNTQLGDGWRFRGRGLIQVTGRANYAEVGLEIGLDLVADPDALLSPANAARAAGAFWAIHGLNALADRGDIAAITRAVNGGQTGLAERTTQVARAKAIWRA